MNHLRQEFASYFLTLKKLNRLDKLRTKQSRDNTQARRQQVDSYHLQLQNLLYEVLHLEKEVSKCLQFKSGDEDIDLVPIEEFYQSAPAEISKPVKYSLPTGETNSMLNYKLPSRVGTVLKDSSNTH